MLGVLKCGSFFFLLQKFVFDCWHAVLETAGQQLLVSLKKSLWRPLDEYEYDVLVVDKRFRNDQTRTNSQIDCFLFCWVHVNVDVDLLAVDRCGALLARGSGLVDCYASWLLASYEPWFF